MLRAAIVAGLLLFVALPPAAALGATVSSQLALYDHTIVWQTADPSEVGAPKADDIYGATIDPVTHLAGTFPICTLDSAQKTPDVWGNIVVWCDYRPGPDDLYTLPDGDIFGYDIGDSTEFPIATASGDQKTPSVSGSLVVWADGRDLAARSWDIYAYDLTTHTEFAVSRQADSQTAPDISGATVVWVDRRNDNADGTNPDIYGATIDPVAHTATTFPICVNTAKQNEPAIDGNTVVWTDYRHGSAEIYSYNLLTHVESRLSTNGQHAEVSGKTVVWQQDSAQGTFIAGENLATGRTFTVAQDAAGDSDPHISGKTVVYLVGSQNQLGVTDLGWQASLAVVGAVPGWAGSTSLTLALDAATPGSLVTGVRYSQDGLTWSSWEPYGSTGSNTVSPGDGLRTLYAQCKDDEGSLSPAVQAGVTIDTTPPVTGDDADAAWHNAAVTVSLSAQDSGYGHVVTQYKIDGATGWTEGSSVVIPAPADHSNDGSHTIAYHSVDGLGNAEATKTTQVRIDTTAPGLAGSVDDLWHNGPVTVSLTASDSASGVATTEYAVDGGAWQTGTAFQVTGDGVHTVSYRATDNAGNTSTASSGQVKIDTTAPATTQTGADTGLWNTDWVVVTFSAADSGSGVAKTEYNLDGAGWITATDSQTEPIKPVSTRQTHTLLYRSIDTVGNVESAKSCEVKTEATIFLLPFTTATSTTPKWKTAWLNSDVTVTFTALAGTAAVGHTEYSTNGGATWTTGTSVTVAAPADHSNDGGHAILYRSIDVDQHAETPKTVTVHIDTTPPATTQTGGDGAWHNHDVTVTLSAHDANAGVATTEYSLDGGTTWTEGNYPFIPVLADHSTDGMNVVLYRSTDTAGNREADQTCKVGIDTQRPVTKAPYAASVLRYRYVTLRYRVNDPLPGSGKAKVTIKVRTLSGRTVKTLSLGLRRVNATLSYRFRCTLPRRTYRFVVYATDLAGNTQARKGVNRLVVR